MAGSEGSAKNDATESETEITENEIVRIENIVKEIAENEDPCSIFQENLQSIYRASKQDLINLLKQLNSKTAIKLKEQLFYRFVENFDKDTLSENGFQLTETDLVTHLKTRKNHMLLCNDIYNLGLSIYEDIITVKLASEILKPPYIQYPAVIDSNISQILEKLQEILVSNEKLHKDNKDLREHITKLEKKSIENNELIDKLKIEITTLSTEMSRKQQTMSVFQTPQPQQTATNQPTHQEPTIATEPPRTAPKTYRQALSELPEDTSILELLKESLSHQSSDGHGSHERYQRHGRGHGRS